MTTNVVEIRTEDGVAPCHFTEAPNDKKAGAVIIYMDAYGIRPTMIAMAERMASNGFNVLLPDLYYRSAPVAPFDTVKTFNDPAERDRLMALLGSLTMTRVMADTASFLNFLENQPTFTGKVGCVGYCMGGGFALAAAGTFPDKIGAAASLHGGRLATDKPDSPHLLAPKIRGEIYVGIAGIDDHFTDEEKQRLEASLQNAGVKHTVQVYEGVKHGFAVADTLAYDRDASERHWEKIVGLFAANL